MEPESARYTNGEYLRSNPTWSIEDSRWKARLIHNLLGKNSIMPDHVAEVGCGAGGILHELSLLNPEIKKLSGYDISPQALALAAQFASERIHFYQGDYANEIQEDRPDLLLVIDVVEHVADYYGFVRKLRERMRYIVFHIPLDCSCRTILKPHVMLQQRQAVGHLHYFSEEMVWWILNDTGYHIIDWCYTKPITDLSKSTSFRQFVKKKLRNLSFAMNRKKSVKLWGGYSLMILAEAKSQ